MREQQKIKAIVFDLDDTLIDWSKAEVSWADTSRHHMSNIYNYLAKTKDLLPNKETFLTLYRDFVINSWAESKKSWVATKFEQVLLDTFVACGIDVAHDEMEAVLQAYDWQPIPGIEPYADTLKVLDSIKEQGYKIGLITNAMQPIWMRDIELRAYNILDYLDARITSGDTGFIKPHPSIYTHMLEMLDVEPAQAVFVGDRPANDIAGANETGLVSVLMDPPHLDYELNGVIPDYKISELAQLLPILVELEH